MAKPAHNIPLARPDITKREFSYVKDCFATNHISQGPYNERFEEALKKRIGVSHATLVSNGTAALWIALRACGIGKGDEVIVPAFTFSATAAAVIAVGADVVFVDVLEKNTNIDPAKVAKAITKKTKAIIAVDLYGFAADYRALKKIAREHDLYVIEDAAESLGGSYNDRALGTLGDIGCFSLYANKVITSGEGGVCVTDSKKLHDSMVLLKNHGTPRTRAYFVEVSGFNMRMTNVQAAIALGQIERMDQFLSARYTIFETYQNLAKEIPQVKTLPYDERTYGPWLYTLRVPAASREHVLTELSRAGIEARPGFHALHKTPAFAAYAKGKRFPVSEQLASEIINLPTFVGLKESDIRYVVKTLQKILTA